MFFLIRFRNAGFPSAWCLLKAAFQSGITDRSGGLAVSIASFGFNQAVFANKHHGRLCL